MTSILMRLMILQKAAISVAVMIQRELQLLHLLHMQT